ncbi:MAG: CRISPR-associated helicase Cas3', partial [Fusobacterium sp.]|nr:CRISPR-associated helicase Cas3' [Fusobacterium sp.]
MEFDFVKFEEIFDLGNSSYYAHHKIENETKKNETLQNHIFLSEKYFKLLIEEKKFDKIFDKIFNSLKFEEKYRKFYYKLISNIVSFHDFGKINPEYQKQKMKNKDINGLPIDIEGIKGADHSLFSSTVYIDYFFKRMDVSFIKEKDLSKKTQGFLLIELILNFAYLISRHHSDLIEFEDFLQNNDMKNILENLSKIQFLKKLIEIKNKVGPINLLKFYCEQRKNISLNDEDKFAIFILNRILFSLLVGADYYATSEFMKDIETNFFGNIENILDFQNEFENNEIIKGIRKNSEIYLNKEKYEEFENINEYRSKIFLEAESILIENSDKDVFFLEAPTGSGKSNTALNLGFKLLDKDRRKIFYIYPFNTLVEQNKDTLESLFSEKNLLDQIKVVNSITPIDNGDEEDEYISYDKILLDRQFLNYPLIITTHVGIFDILIGNTKGNIMPFYQLANSVIIFDEIQAYKNEIWTEIMMILEKYANILNIKIIMMSATLPDLSLLTQNKNVVRLMKNRDFYFKAPIFKDRVKLDFDLLDKEVGLEEILEHIIDNSLDFSKILVEFISKKEAKSFYKICKEENLDRDILILTGEDNRARRKE